MNGEPYKDLTNIGVEAEIMAKKIIEEGLKDVDEVWGSGDDSFCFSCANGTIYSGCECGNNHIIDDDNRNSFTIDLIEKNDSIIEVINCK